MCRPVTDNIPRLHHCPSASVYMYCPQLLCANLSSNCNNFEVHHLEQIMDGSRTLVGARYRGSLTVCAPRLSRIYHTAVTSLCFHPLHNCPGCTRALTAPSPNIPDIADVFIHSTAGLRGFTSSFRDRPDFGLHNPHACPTCLLVPDGAGVPCIHACMKQAWQAGSRQCKVIADDTCPRQLSISLTSR